jgi:hypothetical protein
MLDVDLLRCTLGKTKTTRAGMCRTLSTFQLYEINTRIAMYCSTMFALS